MPTDTGWTVTLEVEDRDAPPVGTDLLVELTQLLKPWGGAVSGRTTHGRYGATFSDRTDSVDPALVVGPCVRRFEELAARAGLPAFPVVVCDLMTFAEHDRWLDEG
jgi:hypothetical protein